MEALEDEHKDLESPMLRKEMDIPNFFHEEWVRFVLSRIHEQYVWLDKPYKITRP